MADSVVSFLLDNLSLMLVDEQNLLSGVEDKVTSLVNELKFIDIFLKSSDGKRKDDMLKQVVSQIRDVAYEAEDVVDTYVANVTMHRSRKICWKLLCGKDHVMMLHDVNAQIEKIKGKIDEIYKNKDRYGIGEGEFGSGDIQEAAESIRRRRRYVEEEDVVGLVHDSNVVIDQLMGTDPRLNVVSIIGMGGLGKTTLARKIYNNNHVKQLFPCRAWGYVSTDYRERELWLSLLQSLMSSTSEYEDLRDEELKKKVQECLSGNKYLVVLDDIWKTEAWDVLKDVFPDDHQSGSRILITSRIKEVAFYVGTTFSYDLPFLDQHDSWTLFSKKAFPREEWPSGLEDLGKSIVKGCGGLPLAIVVLAGIVAKKDNSQRETWLRSIKNHINWHLTQDNNKVMDILKLSYDSLPSRLKPCFLYFGIYPEDYEIPVRQLIQLWIAEGFIQAQEETGISNAPEPEEVAEYYLDELVDRSIVQAASRRTDGGVKTCRIHDLLRDLCISESKADKFIEVYTKSNTDILSNPRRLSLNCMTHFHLSSNKGNKSWTRSLFFFGKVVKTYPEHILNNFKLIRVLDMNKVYFLPSQPRDLKTMIHLRYLRISNPLYIESAKTLLASICSLWNLQTIDVRKLYVKSVPSGMRRLKWLKHLYMGINASLPAMWNLQTLCWLALNPRTASLVDNGNFPNLRKLGLEYMEDDWGKFFAHEQLRCLHHLSNLRTLKIRGTSDLPLDANVFPLNLTKITLMDFDSFDSRSMNVLGQLTNLQILKLSSGRITDSINFATNEFPQLQVFQMAELDVKSWGVDKGAMPRLRRLLINNCKHVSELPEELWSLTTLREVHAVGPSKQLANYLQCVEVKNGCKLIVSHPKKKTRFFRRSDTVVFRSPE